LNFHRPTQKKSRHATIFGIATSLAKLEALISSLETNSIPLNDITVLMPGDPPDPVPPEAAAAQAISDDFSGNPSEHWPVEPSERWSAWEYSPCR